MTRDENDIFWNEVRSEVDSGHTVVVGSGRYDRHHLTREEEIKEYVGYCDDCDRWFDVRVGCPDTLAFHASERIGKKMDTGLPIEEEEATRTARHEILKSAGVFDD